MANTCRYLFYAGATNEVDYEETGLALVLSPSSQGRFILNRFHHFLGSGTVLTCPSFCRSYKVLDVGDPRHIP